MASGPKIWFVIPRGFHYNGVHYIGVFTHKNYCNFARLKNYFVITGTSFYRGSTVQL